MNNQNETTLNSPFCFAGPETDLLREIERWALSLAGTRDLDQQYDTNPERDALKQVDGVWLLMGRATVRRLSDQIGSVDKRGDIVRIDYPLYTLEEVRKYEPQYILDPLLNEGRGPMMLRVTWFRHVAGQAVSIHLGPRRGGQINGVITFQSRVSAEVERLLEHLNTMAEDREDSESAGKAGRRTLLCNLWAYAQLLLGYTPAQIAGDWSRLHQLETGIPPEERADLPEESIRKAAAILKRRYPHIPHQPNNRISPH